MASLSRPAPNGHFIKRFGQFVKASSNQKGRPKIWPSEAQSAIPPHKQFFNGRSLQSRPAPMSRPAPNGHFIKGFNQFIKASSNQKGRPLDLALGRPIRYCAAQAVYQRPAGVLGGSIRYCAAQAVYQRPPAMVFN